MTARRTTTAGIRGPLGLSALVHVGVIVAAAVLARAEPATALPPVYRVKLFAAPPGPRQMGVVQPPSAAAPEPAPSAEPATPPPAPEIAERPMPSPVKPADPPKRPQQVATPNPATTRTPANAGAGKAAAAAETKTPPAKAPPAKAPVAGGGPTGGRGADVANVDTPGIDFPYPTYLQNIVRQVITRFDVPANTQLVTQVRFTIRRDGSVTAIAIHKGSGNYEFDTEARAAVESAGRLRAFGPLPDGYPDDALTVYFAFDPNIIR